MSRTEEEREEGMNRLPDRILWQRCRTADAPEDEVARFLDLAAFADGRLETDEHDRVAALLARDPTAAADVAAGRVLAGALGETSAGLDRVIARACAILPDAPGTPGRLVPFRRPSEPRRILHGLTQWGSLAAAIAIASWLGFAMGSEASFALGQVGPSIDTELLDPGTGFLRDLGEGQRL